MAASVFQPYPAGPDTESTARVVVGLTAVWAYFATKGRRWTGTSVVFRRTGPSRPL